MVGRISYIQKPVKIGNVLECLKEIKGNQHPEVDDHTKPRQISLSGYKILIADDNSLNQLVVSRPLERMGAQCQLVFNGLEAMEAVEAAAKAGSPFDYCLMDVQMPICDGMNFK